MDLYDIVHQAFIDALAETRRLELKLRGSTNRRSQEPVLCFSREDEHDVVLDGHKVLGSAQRRRRGAILQHGGFLLQASPLAPRIAPGIADLVGTPPI